VPPLVITKFAMLASLYSGRYPCKCTAYASVFVMCLFEPQSTVSARTRSRLIQIDVDLGVPKRSASTVTYSLATVNYADGFLCYQLHRADRVRLQFHRGLFESWTGALCRSRSLTSRPWSWIVWRLRRRNGCASSHGSRRDGRVR